MTIKAPFNFVPVSDIVFTPDWADKISHDIPFSDGENGEIEITLSAITPLFIRNGHSRLDADKQNETYTSFSKDPNGNSFIPATSIKGMIRNVLEIISFGKMDKISNDRYSIRDLQLKRYLNFFQNSDIHCGWMTKKDNNTIEITNNGIPRRISHKDLDKYWDTNFADRFKDSTLLKADENRTALYKINLAREKELNGSFIELPLNPNNPVDKRIKVKFEEDGSFKGTIVLTGQPSARKDIGDIDSRGRTILKGEGKCFEFVFSKSTEGEPFLLDIDDETGLYNDFCFVYKDSVDWDYWRKKMDEGNPVPIFFSLKNDKLQHFGLSYLYKLPFKNRIKEFLPFEHKKLDDDLCECIFGKTGSKKSIKGRVQFMNMTLESGDVSDEIRKPYMGSPKPTYYPIYLVQNGINGFPNGEFCTMLSDSPKLKGWKRYPVHDDIAPFIIPEGMKEENLNPFYPVNSGSKFIGRIKFHNLRKVEIGALMQSLLLNGYGFHSLGFAKAYGFGKVKIDIIKTTGLAAPIDEYVKSFNEFMESKIPNYSKSRELKEFYAMSIPQNIKSSLEYMDLEDFVNCKRQKLRVDLTGQYLQYYTDLILKTTMPEPVQLVVESVITFAQKPNIQAKLLEGKDIKPKPLINFPDKHKFKLDERILVKRVMQGGNIKSLSFVRFL